MKKLFSRLKLHWMLILGILFCWGAYAATTSNSVITAQTPDIQGIEFTHSSNPGTYVSAYLGGTNGSKIVGVVASTDDLAAAHYVTCGVFLGGSQYASTTVLVSANSALPTGSYTAFNMFSPSNWPGLPVDSDGNPYVYLMSAGSAVNTTSYVLECTFSTTITSGDFININAIGADF